MRGSLIFFLSMIGFLLLFLLLFCFVLFSLHVFENRKYLLRNQLV